MKKHDNPWKTLSTRLIYDNPWIKVEEDQVLTPAGTPGIYGKVHFKNRAYGIIPLDDQLNTCLVGQYRYTLGAYSWEIPMGGGQIGEDRLSDAKRELKEETGLVAQKWTEIMQIHTSNSVTDEHGLVYLAEELTQETMEWDETELLALKFVSLQSAIEMVMTGEITDAISVAGLLKVGRLYGI
jgi:ADP-ribose pyrophosphatase